MGWRSNYSTGGLIFIIFFLHSYLSVDFDFEIPAIRNALRVRSSAGGASVFFFFLNLFLWEPCQKIIWMLAGHNSTFNLLDMLTNQTKHRGQGIG